jgi:hypothetical protein
MGGDGKKNPKLMQLGIFVRGNATVNRTDAAGASFSTLDFGKFGSLNLIITQFPRVLLPYDFLDELRDVWASGQIRPDAFIFLTPFQVRSATVQHRRQGGVNGRGKGQGQGL